MKKKLVQNGLVYYYTLFLILLLVFIPKGINILLSIFPIRMILCFGLFIAFLFDVFIYKRKPNKISKFLCFFYILFIFFMILGAFKTTNFVIYIYSLLKFISMGLVFYVILKTPFSKKQVNNLITLLIFSSMIVSIIGILQYIFGISLNINGVYKYPGSIGRISATFYNPIYLGIYLMLMIILSYYKIVSNEKMKCVYATAILIDFSAMMLTFTRTVAVLTILISFIYLIFSIININRKKNIFKYNFVIFILLIVLIFSIPGSKYLYSSTIMNFLPYNVSIKVLETLNNYFATDFDLKLYKKDDIKKQKDENIDNSIEETKGNSENNQNTISTDNFKESNEVIEDASLISRDEFKNISIKVIQDNFYSGVGVGTYEDYVNANFDKYVSNRFGYPHNLFLHIFAETGVFAFFVFGLLYASIWIISFIFSIIKKNNEMFTLSVIMTVMFILAFYESYLYDTQLAPLLLVVISLLLSIYKISNYGKEVMFISSVGGHLTQLLQLKEMFTKYDYVLVTEKNDVSYALMNEYNIKFLPYCSRNEKYTYPFILMYSCFKSLVYFIKYNPKVIITTGANTAAAMCCFGKLFGKKVIYIESFAKRFSPTITGKCIYKLKAYTTFVVQWEELLKFYPNAEFWGGLY